ncbi:MAG: hypothetical protein KAT28_02040 [Candidatus Aenigmarchaeota archaeon]|nr:hypothetical protein [Candidatus Aenigmarchaeota archaeon]
MAKQELKSIGVLSFAVVLGLMEALIGLVMGIFIAVGGVLIGSMLGGAAEGGIIGIFAIIVYPIMFFIMGFLGGAIVALVYNFVADKYKGIELEFI